MKTAFKIEEYIVKLSERELKSFTYYDYGYLSFKTKDEFYRVLNKSTVNGLKKYTISKYHKQSKYTSMLESKVRTCKKFRNYKKIRTDNKGSL